MQIQYYNARGHDRALAAKDLARVRISRNSLLWINGTADEVNGLDLPDPIRAGVDRCSPSDQAVEVHDAFYCLAIPVLSHPGEDASDSLCLVVGQDWLVSIGEGAAIDFGEIVNHDAGETMKGKLSGSSLAAALVAEHFNRVHRRIATINREIDRMEERVLTGREGKHTLAVMAVLRRQVSRLRHLVDAYRGIIHNLTRPDFLPDLAAEDKKHFTHLLAAYERLEDEVARLRDAVVASFELYATRVAQDTNRLVRTLTVFTIGIGLVAALAGVFGMNFRARLFEQGEQGFYLATWIMLGILATTAAIAGITYRRP